MRVVLPAPLRPTSPTRSPVPTRRLASDINGRAPARSSSWEASITAPPLASGGLRIGRRPEGVAFHRVLRTCSDTPACPAPSRQSVLSDVEPEGAQHLSALIG